MSMCYLCTYNLTLLTTAIPEVLFAKLQYLSGVNRLFGIVKSRLGKIISLHMYLLLSYYITGIFSVKPLNI